MKNEEIISQLKNENVDSMFVYSPENIKYVSGFYPSSFAYLIIQDEPVLYVNSIDKESAEEKSLIETKDIVKLSEVKDLLEGTIAVESSLEFDLVKRLSDDVSSIKTSNVFVDKRKTKTKEEITNIKNSIGIAENAIKERSSSPHSETSMNRVETPIVVDWGAKYNHYCSDITRTFIDSERQEEIWNIVLEAQKAAINSIAPGISYAEVDNAARDVISEYGYGEYFIHSTGHGFGLDIHEDPVISNKAEGILEENMVITAEPGIYIPGEFGVRIEDDILVKKNSQVLTTLDKKLDFTL